MNKRKKKDDALFKKTKIAAYERSNGICELCKRRKVTDIHHIIYRSQLGTSQLDNLMALCRECHEKAHGVNAKEYRLLLQKIRRNNNEEN